MRQPPASSVKSFQTKEKKDAWEACKRDGGMKE